MDRAFSVFQQRASFYGSTGLQSNYGHTGIAADISFAVGFKQFCGRYPKLLCHVKDIIGVTTSNRTAKQARDLGITIKDIDDVDHIDLTIDGADEISDDFQGIKGGGGALLWEKIVANASNKVMWIVDESKLVHKLGAFPLPVEVIPFGSQHVFDRLEKKGYKPTWRMDGDKKFRTDENNYIIDLHLGEIDDPKALADELIHMVGIVETGLFLNRVNDVIVGTPEGPKVLHAR